MSKDLLKNPRPSTPDPQSKLIVWILSGLAIALIVFVWVGSLSGILQVGVQGVQETVASVSSFGEKIQMDTEDSRGQIAELAESVKQTFMDRLEAEEAEAKAAFAKEMLELIEEDAGEQIAEEPEEALLEESLTEQEVVQEEN